MIDPMDERQREEPTDEDDLAVQPETLEDLDASAERADAMRGGRTTHDPDNWETGTV